MEFEGNFYQTALTAWWIALAVAGFHVIRIYKIKRYIREMHTEHVRLEAENRALRVIISGQKKTMETMSLAMIRKSDQKPKEQEQCHEASNIPD